MAKRSTRRKVAYQVFLSYSRQDTRDTAMSKKARSAPKVFIGSTRQDLELARDMARRLRLPDLELMTDLTLPPGEDFSKRVGEVFREDAVERCTFGKMRVGRDSNQNRLAFGKFLQVGGQLVSAAYPSQPPIEQD